MVSPNPLVGDVRTIERDELLEKVERGDESRLVMALNEWAFRAKHIPGSEHFNSPDELFSSLRSDDEVVVYCTSPECHSSIALYMALVDSGFTHVKRYAGGLSDWGGRRSSVGGRLDVVLEAEVIVGGGELEGQNS